MKKFITAMLASVIATSSALAIDLSTYTIAGKPTPAPVIEHQLPHIPWDADAHNKFFDLVMTQVMNDNNLDLDPDWTTPMIVSAVKCMDAHFSSEYGFAQFLGNWDIPSDDFTIEIELTTELGFTSSYLLHSTATEEVDTTKFL